MRGLSQDNCAYVLESRKKRLFSAAKTQRSIGIFLVFERLRLLRMHNDPRGVCAKQTGFFRHLAHSASQ
jgi:hypothetical protein